MADKKFDVLGIGNAIVDVLARVDDDFLDERDIPKGSMQLIDEAGAHALYDAMTAAVEVSGGSAANTIAGLAQLGARAAFIGKVRNDQLGEVFAHDIRASGVHFETAAATRGPSTARCLVLVTPDGERTLNTYLGASVGLEPEDIDAEAIAASGIVYLEGYLWDPPQAKEAFVRAAAIARDAERQVALTLSDSFCVDRHRESFHELIRRDVDILFANESEIKSLYETNSFDDALQAVRHDCRFAVLTRSAAGSVIVDGNDVHVVEARKVGQVVDATGAGDLFASGFLYGFSQGKDLKTSAQIGAVAAAQIISQIGARPQVDLRELAAAAGLI